MLQKQLCIVAEDTMSLPEIAGIIHYILASNFSARHRYVTLLYKESTQSELSSGHVACGSATAAADAGRSGS